ncbi:MAG TPA: thioredoxin fold domain-containing protein [Gammaproteobacteria bacterium]
MRGHLLALLSLLASLVAAPIAMAGDIPLIKDLRKEASQAQEKRLPLLVMFSADQCPYCVRIEEDFLKPMHSGGYYDDKVIIRRVKLGSGSGSVNDFDGSRISASELAERYDVSVTPTLVFIDAQGRQLTQKLVGLTTPELFGGYLDQAIDTSLDRLRRTTPLAVKVSSN